jgi:hypothetical protein
MLGSTGLGGAAATAEPSIRCRVDGAGCDIAGRASVGSGTERVASGRAPLDGSSGGVDHGAPITLETWR